VFLCSVRMARHLFACSLVMFWILFQNVLAFQRTISTAMNGYTFEPTVTTNFPFTIRNANGAPFTNTSSNYYGCAYTNSGDPYFPYPAMIDPLDPSVLRCAYERIQNGCDMDVYLFGNYLASFEAGNENLLVQLAYWQSELNPSPNCPPQPTNRYTSWIPDSSGAVWNVSKKVEVTIGLGSGTVGITQLDTTMWYVCAWYVYTAANSIEYDPPLAWTNFTATSGSTGYCYTPVFKNVVPFQLPIIINHFLIVAYDGSWDTYECQTVTDSCYNSYGFYEFAQNIPPPPSAAGPCVPSLFSPCAGATVEMSRAVILGAVLGLYLKW